MTTLRCGAVCGESTVVRLVGAGEVADVYEVRTADGSRRAIKILRQQVPLEARAQSRIAQEAETLAMLEHVNLLRYHRGGIHEGRVWVEVELVDGADLRRVMGAGGGKVPIERAVGLLRQVCEGLDAAHRQKVIHRDLKPENVLVGRDDLVKVGDFGNAKLPGWGLHTTHTQRTRSALYMAPELWQQGVAVTAEADVYSVGVILYEAIAGEHPIAPGPATLAQICLRQRDYTPPALHEVRGDIPLDISLLLQRAMSKSPEPRGSLRDFFIELEAAQLRLLAWRRASARNIPLPNRVREHAATEKMPRWNEAPSSAASSMTSSTVPLRAPVSGPPRWVPATEGMPSSVGATSIGDGDRAAMLPSGGGTPGCEDEREAMPAPAPVSVVAPTPRTPSLAAPTLRTPSHPASLPTSSRRASARTVPLSSLPFAPASASALMSAERPSTSVPVESTALPQRRGQRARRRAGMCAAAAMMGIAVWWTAFGRDGGRPVAASSTATPASAIGAAASGNSSVALSSAPPSATAAAASATAAPMSTASAAPPANSAAKPGAPPKSPARRQPVSPPVRRAPTTR